MPTWKERFKSHPLWVQLETLGPIIDKAIAIENLTSDAQDSLHRLKVALSFIGKRLAGADTYLVNPEHLDAINSNVTSAINHLQQFLGNHDTPTLDNANSHMNAVLNSLALISVPITTEDYNSLREAANSYRAALEENVRGVNEVLSKTNRDFHTLRDHQAKLYADITDEKARLSALASEHQSQFSTAQEARSQQYTDAQNVRQEKFSELQMKYSEILVQEKTASEEHLKELQRNHLDILKELTANFESKGKELLINMEEQKAQVEKLVGVIGNLGVTSGYQTTANTARTYVFIWQSVLLSTLSGTAWLTFTELLPLLKGDFTIQAFASKLVLLLPLAVLIAYSISQADKYQEVERRTRKQALELEAIGPFLASLPEDKQHEFRLKIGERSFGASVDFVDRGSVKSRASIIDLIIRDPRLRDQLSEWFKGPKS